MYQNYMLPWVKKKVSYWIQIALSIRVTKIFDQGRGTVNPHLL